MQLVEDIKVKKGNRKAELELAFKIKGLLINRQDITSDNLPIPILSKIMRDQIDNGLSNL